MKKTNVQIDWLSISFLGTITDFCGLIPKLNDFSTRQFSKILSLFYESFEFCTIAYQPCSKILNEKLCILKVSNRFLYSDLWFKIVSEILTKNNAMKINISRIDLAVDFQYFESRRKPENLIKSFLKEELLKVGKSKFALHGEVDSSINYQYLQFGKKTSQVNCYMYNKSQEMKEVKNKQWINDKWNNFSFEQNVDIWRLEFSMKNINYSLVDNQTGDIINIVLDILNNSSILHTLFYNLVLKYFSFKYNSTDTNKSRLKDVILFNEVIEEYRRMKLSESIESNKLDKYLIRRLDLLYSELRQPDRHLYSKIEEIKKLFIEKKNLQYFYKTKVEPFNRFIKQQAWTFGNDVYLDCLFLDDF